MKRVKATAAAALMLAGLSLPLKAQLGGGQIHLVEPNIAADSQMAKVGLNEHAIHLIKEARPILSVVTYDSLLGASGLTKAQRATLLTKSFVHVDINRGTDAEMMLVPGMNAARLAAIKAGRPWTSFDGLKPALSKTAGMAQGEIENYDRYFFIPIELNTFTEPLMDTFADIGVGTRRWKREFAEYRPWKSEEQFRREIGKYVRGNPKEVDRLWRYVIIK